MQRGLGGFPHERLHQDGSREQGAGSREQGIAMRCIQTGNQGQRRLYLMSPRNAIFFPSCLLPLASCLFPIPCSLFQELILVLSDYLYIVGKIVCSLVPNKNSTILRKTGFRGNSQMIYCPFNCILYPIPQGTSLNVELLIFC
ncbi:hypothetical protein BJP36_37220 [Moorena producens JHB]|uniref:Uncharacterized protein n=1 Tax=Moorena producens (strain JHB) TaxID=1454205 RepID=A0A9Q9UWD4_MOOP1|nr:hypothetical protein [Moorena producens]WAN69736.1 hypothetical protein BJP36_37220 [Moorena producens JHB]